MTGEECFPMNRQSTAIEQSPNLAFSRAALALFAMRKAFMNLTAHFTLEELVFSSLAVRLKLDNTPSAEVIEHLKLLAMGLEQLRSRLAAPIHIDSGYRCPLLNSLIHGAVHSAHLLGYAADFVCPGFGSPQEIVR